MPRGAGRYSLWGKCNNDTGSWYGAAYVDVARQAMIRLHDPCGMFPLRFLKQIVAMFFSACGPSLQENNPDLVRFVLNREGQRLPLHIRIFLFLHLPTRSTCIRRAGLIGMKLAADVSVCAIRFGAIVNRNDRRESRRCHMLLN